MCSPYHPLPTWARFLWVQYGTAAYKALPLLPSSPVIYEHQTRGRWPHNCLCLPRTSTYRHRATALVAQRLTLLTPTLLHISCTPAAKRNLRRFARRSITRRRDTCSIPAAYSGLALRIARAAYSAVAKQDVTAGTGFARRDARTPTPPTCLCLRH